MGHAVLHSRPHTSRTTHNAQRTTTPRHSSDNRTASTGPPPFRSLRRAAHRFTAAHARVWAKACNLRKLNPHQPTHQQPHSLRLAALTHSSETEPPHSLRFNNSAA